MYVLKTKKVGELMRKFLFILAVATVVATIAGLHHLAIQDFNKSWNNGISPAGEKWVPTRIDSAGEVVYKDLSGNEFRSAIYRDKVK